MAKPVAAFISSFRRDRRGFVAIMLLFTLMPIVALIGLAVEYNSMARAKAELDVAADSAAMVGTTTAFNTATAEIKAGVATDQANSDAAAAGQAAAQQSWNTQTQSLGWVTSGGTATLSAPPTPDINNQYQVQVQYTASMPTTIGAAFKIMNMNIAGISKAKMASTVGNLYFMLDTSESMGIAATPNDMLNLIAATSHPGVPATWSWQDPLNAAGYDNYDQPLGSLDGCAFACHFYAPTAGGQDYYSVAQANHVRLRIDVVQQAVVSTLKNVSGGTNVGIYGFDDQVFTIAPAIGGSVGTTVNRDSALSAAQVIDPVSLPVPPSGTRNINLGCICIERMVHLPSPDPETDHMGDSDLPHALTQLETNLPKLSTQGYLFLITDGVVDTGVIGSETITNYKYSNACSTFKSVMATKNIKVFVLEITYWPVDSTSAYPAPPMPVNTKYGQPFGDTPYDDDVAPFLGQFQSSLQACADNWYQASDPASIQGQMNQMLKDASFGNPEALFTQ